MNARECLLEYIDAYNAKNVARMLAIFDDGCVFENISAGKVTVCTKGKAELEALAEKSAEAFASRELEVISVTQEGARIVAEIDFDGTLQANLSPELRVRSELRLRGVAVIEVKNGKIVRLSDYS